MASIILAAAGTAIGGSIGGTVLGVSAATIGGAVGSLAGAAIDSWLVASMAPTQRSPASGSTPCRSPPRPRAR